MGRRLPPLSLSAWLRYDVVRGLLRALPVQRVLEVGAGQGALGTRLAADYDYTGVEPDARSCATARRRLAARGRGHMARSDVAGLHGDARFDVVCAFEVLEHLPDDDAALREWRERVRPGGWLLLSVPAWSRRWGAADELVGHYRRYSPAQLAARLVQAGFEDPRIHLYGFPLGYLLEAVRNAAARRARRADDAGAGTAASGRWLQPPSWLASATMLATLPFRVLQRPFTRTRLGTGIVALARRPHEATASQERR